MVVLDTSTLIFWTLDRDKLSAKAQSALLQKQQKVISAISIWEIGLKAKQGKLNIPLSIQAFATQLNQIDNFEILPVDTKTWLKNLELDWDHKDPADRTIVATASLLDCPLITSDQKMLAYYSQTIW